jgi:hypothetical protein
MTDQASVNIPKDLLEPIIRQHIAAGVVAAIGDPAALIRAVVDRACKEKVNSEGKRGQYDSDNKYDFVEQIAGNAIREATRKAVMTYVEEQRPAIETAVVAHLKRSTTKFAKTLVDGLVESTKQRWNINCEFVAVDVSR